LLVDEAKHFLYHRLFSEYLLCSVLPCGTLKLIRCGMIRYTAYF
jgi:hypothetical protein